MITSCTRGAGARGYNLSPIFILFLAMRIIHLRLNRRTIYDYISCDHATGRRSWFSPDSQCSAR